MGNKSTLRQLAADPQQGDEVPTVKLKPSSYQPSKAELEEAVRIDAAPADVARAVMRPMKIAPAS